MPEVRMDEFAFVLLAGIILIFMLMFAWTTPAEPAPMLMPESVELSVQRGSSSAFDLTVNGSSSGSLTNVSLTASGQIKNWVRFNKNNFDISDSAVVTVTVKVPSATLTGTYSGRINVKSEGGEDSISVSIEVVEKAVEERSRPIVLGDFSVSYSVGSQTLDSKENLEISAGYLSTRSASLVGILSEDRLSITTDGYIRLVIDETNSAGNLIVLVNDKEVYSKRTGLGEVIIPVDKELLVRSNTITIKAGSPGWRFWMSTVYKIRSATFVTNYKGIFSKSFDFSLSSTEMATFDHFELFYRVRNYSKPLPELMIKINGQIVFWEIPEILIFDRSFEEDILGNKILAQESNTISFLFEKEAFYDVADAMLTVYY